MDVLTEKKSIHRHGGSPRADFAKFEMPEAPVLDFSVNLNPLGPPAVIRNHWMEMIRDVQDYPTMDGEGVARFYGEKYGLPPENCLGGNGSTEFIYLLPRVLKVGRVLVAGPSYNDYARASTLAGATVYRHSLLRDSPGVSFDNYRVLEELGKADALWVGSPNNPTGTLFPRDRLLECAGEYPDKWIIVDEAFMPFVEGNAEHSLARPPFRKNIIVLHSITKFYALAGLRLGGVLGHEGVISRLRAAKEPWTVNRIAEKMAPFLVECGDYGTRTRTLVNRERERLFQALKSMPGVVPFPSAANFILCRWRLTDNLDDLQRYLLNRGLYVRDCRNFPGLEENYFRLAVRLPEENDLLISALDAFPGNGRADGFAGASLNMN